MRFYTIAVFAVALSLIAGMQLAESLPTDVVSRVSLDEAIKSDGSCTEQIIQDRNRLSTVTKLWMISPTTALESQIEKECTEFVSKYSGVECTAVLNNQEETLSVDQLKESCESFHSI